MNWADRYIPPVGAYSHGRTDVPGSSCFFQVIQQLNLRNALPAGSQGAFALLGFQCDEGVSRNQGREGAVEGPNAIREALAKLPVNKPGVRCFDAGDIICADNNLEASQAALGEAVALLLKHQFTPIVLGGGHEMAWGHYQGIAQHCPKEKLGIINFDAHFDMRPLLAQQQGSSGTPFLQIAEAHAAAKKPLDYNCLGIQPAGNIPLLFATAKKYNVHFMLAEDMVLGAQNKIADFLRRVIADNEKIYLSLCLDVFASDIAPGVSAPQAMGLTPWQVIPFIRQLASSGKVLSYDIAELSPRYDIDHRTAKLAAAFVYEIIHSHKGVT